MLNKNYLHKKLYTQRAKTQNNEQIRLFNLLKCFPN